MLLLFVGSIIFFGSGIFLLLVAWRLHNNRESQQSSARPADNEDEDPIPIWKVVGG